MVTKLGDSLTISMIPGNRPAQLFSLICYCRFDVGAIGETNVSFNSHVLDLSLWKEINIRNISDMYKFTRHDH